MSNSELAKFTAPIDAAWKDLHSFLAAVTPSQASKRDPAGWSVKDHVAHLAVWEDSVTILFRGGRRHEALGIEEPFYTARSLDEINEVIKVRLEGTALQEAIRSLEGAHRQLSDLALGHIGPSFLPAVAGQRTHVARQRLCCPPVQTQSTCRLPFPQGRQRSWRFRQALVEWA